MLARFLGDIAFRLVESAGARREQRGRNCHLSHQSATISIGVGSLLLDRGALTRIARLSLLVLITSCGAGDSRVPWDKADIVRDVTSDLRRFEHLTSDFTEVEVLAWR